MKKRCMALIAALVMVIGMIIPVQAEDEPSVDVRHSVAAVAIGFRQADGQEIEVFSKGSGFFVGISGENPEYLVTNHHVIENYLNGGAGEIGNIYIYQLIDNQTGVSLTPPPENTFKEIRELKNARAFIKVYFNSEEYVEAYAVDYDAKKDLALLRLEAPTDRRTSLKICEPDDSMAGDTVRAVGYPGLADNLLFESTSKWDEGDATITTGTISRLITITGTGVRAIQTDARIQHGNSGGPLVNEKNAVIGVNAWGISNNNSEEVDYAVDVREVTPMLKLHDVEYEMVSNEESKWGFNKNILYIIVIAAAGIVIIGIVVILLLKKKKSTAVEKKEDINTTVIQDSLSTKVPVVSSLSTQHNGMRMSLKNRQIVIGRDSSACTIVYQEGTAGVSGRHCSLTWDQASGEFILTDLNSTYGTFLNTGKRLDAGVAYRLKAGDTFYLGDSKNMLRVGME